MKKNFFFIGGLLMSLLTAFSQTKARIQPLSIGDTVPDFVWNHLVCDTPSAADSGKLVILDFWGKYCSPCIKALPVLDSLQRLFKDDIRVITVSDFTDTTTWLAARKRLAPLQHLRIPALLADSMLSAAFDHRLVSHVVWIDAKRVIRAMTGTEYVTAAHIRQLLHSGSVDWPVKKDVLDFDYTEPLLTWSNSTLLKPAYQAYSTFTGHVPGIAPPSGTFYDEARNRTYTMFYNYSLLALCELALHYTTGAHRSRFVLQVADTGRYIKRTDEYQENWNRTNTYCYYAQWPGKRSAASVRDLVQQDLLRWLAVLGVHAKQITGETDSDTVPRYLITEN